MQRLTLNFIKDYLHEHHNITLDNSNTYNHYDYATNSDLCLQVHELTKIHKKCDKDYVFIFDFMIYVLGMPITIVHEVEHTYQIDIAIDSIVDIIEKTFEKHR